MTLREFFAVMRARWRSIALATLLVTAVAALITARMTPVYTAQAKVYFLAQGAADTSKNDSGNSDDSNAPTRTSGGFYLLTKEDLQTYAEILQAPAVQEPLAKNLDLPEGTPINVRASVSESSTMMTFTAQSDDPTLAADIANEAGPTLAKEAIKFSPLLRTSGQEVKANMVTPATVPGAPSSPNLKRNLLLGLLLGFILGIAIALVRHSLDTKVRTEEDLKALSDRPMLARLPFVKGAGDGWTSMVDDPYGSHAEAIRRLRANMMFVDIATGRHSFVITSSIPGEGKTTTSINLAHATADAGLKTLLIDSDLRNPSVASRMGIEGALGLTTVLLGRARPDEVIQRIGETNLYVMAAGAIPPNPSELIGSKPMEELFDYLSTQFDFILVDSPPVVPVIDAALIQKLTGGLILVVGAGRTRKRDLASAVRQLTTADARIAGFALNKDASATGSGNYYYGYGRYGRYGRTGQSTEKGMATNRDGSAAALASSLSTGEHVTPSRRSRRNSERRRSDRRSRSER